MSRVAKAPHELHLGGPIGQSIEASIGQRGLTNPRSLAFSMSQLGCQSWEASINVLSLGPRGFIL